MSKHYVFTVGGIIKSDVTSDDHAVLTCDGQTVYDSPAAAQQPPTGSFPYELRPMPPNGATGKAAIAENLVQGVTYAFLLNGTPGQVSITPEGGAPLMGTNAGWEVALSRAPGDWATAMAMDKTENTKEHKFNTPYYAKQGGQSGGFNWSSTADGTGRPVVPAGEQWYLNLRITTPTKPGADAIYVQPPQVK